VKKASAPTSQDNDCFESNPGNVENCTMEAEGGPYFIKVPGYDVFNRVALRILWSD